MATPEGLGRAVRPAFSIVVVARNEARSLPHLLSSLWPFRERGGDLLVVDTGSQDETTGLARDFGCRVAAAGDSFADAVDPARVVVLLNGELPRGLEAVAAAAGAHAEPRDAPLRLRLEGGAPGRLLELLDRLKRDGGELAGAFEAEAGPQGVRVRLLVSAGERPSAGRFLAALKPLAQAAGIELVTADREVPSFAAAPRLQSPAPISTPDSEADRSGPPGTL